MSINVDIFHKKGKFFFFRKSITHEQNRVKVSKASSLQTPEIRTQFLEMIKICLDNFNYHKDVLLKYEIIILVN